MNRDEVYEIINEEREYQEKLESRPLPIEGELLLLEEYVAKARNLYVHTISDQTETKTRNEIRKIAAIAIRCIENHGTPRREK